MSRRAACSPLFPYTTLFRSVGWPPDAWGFGPRSSAMPLELTLSVTWNGERQLERHRSEEHTSELQSRFDLVCRLLLEKKKTQDTLTHASPAGSKTLVCVHFA